MRGKFVKNLTYPSIEKIRWGMSHAASTADYISVLLHWDYSRRGTQVQVTKAVSDDLMATEFPIDALTSEIPWLADTMEFYYHDPNLPSMIMTKFEENYILVGMEDTEGQYCTLNLPSEMAIEFITEATAPSMIGAVPLTEAETKDLHTMFLLALKVLAFASIPKYRPPPLTRKTMHHGGKPGIHGRPQRPAVQVIYLPRIIKEHEAQAATHKFKGRIGVIHYYRHERFTNRKGTWDYFPPIIDPTTGKYPPPRKTVYKVRKVEVG